MPRAGYGFVGGDGYRLLRLQLASWPAFADDVDAVLALGIAFVLAIVFFALPVSFAVAVANSHSQSAPVDIATGPPRGSNACCRCADPAGAGRHLDRRGARFGALTPPSDSPHHLL
jgi:hypothetical protein